MRPDDPISSIDIIVPISVRGVPGEMVVPNRMGEPSILVFRMLELVTYDLAVESFVLEIHPTNECATQGVGGGGSPRGNLQL